MAERTVEGKEPGNPSLAIQTSLHTLVQGQIESISAFHTWLNNHVPEAPGCQEVASAIREHLASHKALVLGAEQTLAWPTSNPSCWGPIRCRHASPDGPAFSITGPAPGDRFEVSAAGRADAAASLEKFVSYISKMSENLAAGEAQIRRLIDIISELEELQLGGPPQATVQKHIRLLQQYNDVKDIGQQLIGLIAENRGVPVGSLYEFGQYGVTRED